MAYVLSRLGNLALQQGARDDARNYLDESITTYEQLVGLETDVVTAQSDLATAIRLRGRVEFSAGNFSTAQSFFERDLKISHEVAQANPTGPDAQIQLGYAHSWLGTTIAQSEDVDAAIKHMTSWLEIADHRFRQMPDHAGAKSDYKSALVDLADLKARKGLYPESLELRSKLVALDPQDAMLINLRGTVYSKMEN